MDGVAVGMLFEKVKDIEMDDFIIPFESPEILDAPAFKDRMFIKTKKNRDFLKRFCDSDEFPNFKSINFEREPNMIHIQKMCDDLKQLGYRSLPTETRKIFHDFSFQSSTINLV